MIAVSLSFLIWVFSLSKSFVVKGRELVRLITAAEAVDVDGLSWRLMLVVCSLTLEVEGRGSVIEVALTPIG